MTTSPAPSRWSWQRQLLTALGCALLGVLVHIATFLPVQLATVGLAIGVIGAAFPRLAAPRATFGHGATIHSVHHCLRLGYGTDTEHRADRVRNNRTQGTPQSQLGVKEA